MSVPITRSNLRARAHRWPFGFALVFAACAANQAPLPAHTSLAATPGPAQPRCEAGSQEAALPELTSPELIEGLGSSLDRYALTAALWLEGQPVMVNGDYDFAMAMTMQDVGPAIAAGQRKQANEAMAAALAGVELGTPLRDQLAALRRCGVHAYALLWRKADHVTLRVVADQFARTDGGWELQRGESLEVGDLPLDGEGAWTSARLTQSMGGALGLLLRAVSARTTHAKHQTPDEEAATLR